MTETYVGSTDKITARLEPMTAQDLFATSGLILDGSVDLLLTDPPYIISRESGFKKVNKQGEIGGSHQYAITTDFGKWDTDEGFSMADLQEAMRGAFRALRPNGVAIVFFDLWKASELAQIMKDVGFEGLTMIEWVKTNAVPINSRKNYLSNAREIAVVAHKPLPLQSEPSKFKPLIYNPAVSTGAFEAAIYSGRDRFHPTQKSLSLFEQLIESHTAEGDVVLDCFSGSATTGVAAIRRGRHYIGCEPDCSDKTNYFGKSSERLEKAISDRRAVEQLAA